MKAVAKAGYEVHVICPGLLDNEPVRAKLESSGVVCHDIKMARTGLNPVADFSVLLTLRKRMREIRPDIVLCYTIKPVIYGMLAARLSGVSRRIALITGLGYAFTGQEQRGLRSYLRHVLRRLYKVALDGAHRVIFQNNDDKKLFLELGLVASEEKVAVVNGSGIDVSSFTVAPLPEPPSFLLIARLLGDKGVREYVAAARNIKRTNSNARFMLVGWVDENPDAISHAELDGWIASGDIEFLGKLDDVRPAIANCNIYVLPSYREGTPRTVLEAMAMGRPIVTTDAPGCRETVEPGVNGMLVPVKSVGELEAAMRFFIENPSEISKMGVSSRLIAEEKYDVHKVNKKMLQYMGVATR